MLPFKIHTCYGPWKNQYDPMVLVERSSEIYNFKHGFYMQTPTTSLHSLQCEARRTIDKIEQLVGIRHSWISWTNNKKWRSPHCTSLSLRFISQLLLKGLKGLRCGTAAHRLYHDALRLPILLRFFQGSLPQHLRCALVQSGEATILI